MGDYLIKDLILLEAGDFVIDPVCNEIGLLLMFLLQNLSNDLIYAPDTSIYIWLLIIYFFKLSLRVDN